VSLLIRVSGAITSSTINNYIQQWLNGGAIRAEFYGDNTNTLSIESLAEVSRNNSASYQTIKKITFLADFPDYTDIGACVVGSQEIWLEAKSTLGGLASIKLFLNGVQIGSEIDEYTDSYATVEFQPDAVDIFGVGGVGFKAGDELEIKVKCAAGDAVQVRNLSVRGTVQITKFGLYNLQAALPVSTNAQISTDDYPLP